MSPSLSRELCPMKLNIVKSKNNPNTPGTLDNSRQVYLDSIIEDTNTGECNKFIKVNVKVFKY